MAHNADDETLKKLFERFLESDPPRFQSPSNWRKKDEGLQVSDWRDSTSSAFVARCTPRHPQTPYSSPGLSLSVGQWLRRDHREELWDSVIIRCDEETDGTMTVRVIVSNPDWTRPLQIACIRSRPGDRESMTALACNLDHEEIAGQT